MNTLLNVCIYNDGKNRFAFDVLMRDAKTKKLEHIRYVRAENEEDAKRIAKRVDRLIFGYKRTFASSVQRSTPINLCGN